MKFRIIKDRNGYRVQRRILGFIWLYYCKNSFDGDSVQMRFDSEKEASIWIEEKIEKLSDRPKVIKIISV